MSLTLIATTTVGAGGAGSIEFASIPATYTDLMVVISLRSATGGNVDAYVYVNNDTANYTNRRLYGTGSSAASDTTTPRGVFANPSSYTANTFSSTNLYFPNYAGSTNKSFSIDTVNEQNSATAFQAISAVLWSSTAAINRLTFYTTDSSVWAQYSSASLYGITKGSGGATVSP